LRDVIHTQNESNVSQERVI